MFYLWMVWKYLKGSGRFIGWTSFLSLLGLILAVGSLILTMAVVSGVESLMRKAVIDVSGHFVMMDTFGPIENIPKLRRRLKDILPKLKTSSPFVHAEGLAASQGMLSGVILHGLEIQSYQNILNLENRVVKGTLTLSDQEISKNNLSGDQKRPAVLGYMLANKLNLDIGEEFQIVVPRPSILNEKSFAPKMATFYLAGTLDLGKYDYNDRIVFVQDLELQKLKGWKKGAYSGLRINFQSEQDARTASFQIGEHLGYHYHTRDWYDSNRIFFSEVVIQKWIIFIVLLFIVIVACFNVCSTLFVHVLRRFSDISILKTLGASQSFLICLFITYGLSIGLLGCLGGLLLGWVLCQIVKYGHFLYIPSQIYQFDRLPVEIRAMDLCLILGTTLLICFVATLMPAFKGSRIKPVEGLRYE